MKKREGVHWATLDERGLTVSTCSCFIAVFSYSLGATPKTSDDYFHKWDSILEDDDDDN